MKVFRGNYWGRGIQKFENRRTVGKRINRTVGFVCREKPIHAYIEIICVVNTRNEAGNNDRK